MQHVMLAPLQLSFFNFCSTDIFSIITMAVVQVSQGLLDYWSDVL